MTEQNQKPQEELCALLKKWMDDNDKSQAFIAKALDVSPTLMSQYLGGIYKGDNDNLDKKVKSFLDLQQARKARRKITLPYLETSVARRIDETATMVHEDGIQGILISPPGYGKTMGLQRYRDHHPDVIYLEVDMGYNALVLFQEIHRALFGDTGHKELHNMHVDIINRLRGSGRMIIIDQAEYLPHRALEMLRAVNDNAGVGILLAGLERLRENISGHRGQYAQLRDRIGIVCKLSSITMEDSQLIIQTMLGDKKSEKICSSFYNRSGANARCLVKMVNAAIRIAYKHKCQINEDVVIAAEEAVQV